ncbi:LutC/YkgG family protein [Aestuariivivens insulae]|uniref:LutC/YkgG family protein n=1 Tax=Aestuariivivens insulae TaxID=1621988 RepID=UPI001F57855E|nr:LUD domain-containing protein [Aestuariivivens insulae]
MGSRTEILAKIKTNKPNLIETPIIEPQVFDEGLNLIEEFTKKVEAVGGQVVPITYEMDIHTEIKTLFPDTALNFSTLEKAISFNTLSLDNIEKPQELEDLDVLVLESPLGVAENGAVWVNDTSFPIRVLPFITKHLVLVLGKNDIVPYMHQAYDTLNDFNFGVFISGPSKTADIEQSLVIGAHGALSLTILLKND